MKYLGILAAILFVLMNVKIDNVSEPYKSIILLSIFLIWFILIGVFSIAIIGSAIYEHKKRKKEHEEGER